MQGIDTVQEKVLGQGPQTTESAVEQAKDEFVVTQDVSVTCPY